VPDDHVLNMRTFLGDRKSYDARIEGHKLTCDGAHMNREGNAKAAEYIFKQF